MRFLFSSGVNGSLNEATRLVAGTTAVEDDDVVLVVDFFFLTRLFFFELDAGLLDDALTF